MSRSQAIIVGGGIAASPAFTATDEAIGAGVIVTSDDPAAVGAATFGMDPTTRAVWMQGGLTAGQIATNLRKAVLIGLAQTNVSNVAANAGVLIGNAAGINVTGGTVMTDGIAIGKGAITDGTAVVIGAGCQANCNAGTDRPVIINCTGVTGSAVSSLVAIGDSIGVACNTGIFILGRADTASGGTSTALQGTVENSPGIVIGGGGVANINGLTDIAIGSGARAGGPLFGTEYNNCVALGTNASALGSGATGDGDAIAIGQSASATGSATQAAVAIGRGATAAVGECRIGSATRPLAMMLATGVTVHLDNAGADAVIGTGTLGAGGTVTIATTAAEAGMFVLVTPTSAWTLPPFVSNIVAVTSFDVTSPAGAADAGDTFTWVILKAA